MLLLCILWSCKQTPSESLHSEYPIINPTIKDTTYFTEYVADIESRQNIEIRSHVHGYMDRILADEGSYVKEGQVLFQLINPHFQQELAKAEAQLANALAAEKMEQVSLDNTLRLVEKNIISESELEMAKAKLEAAKAQILEVRAELSNIKLRISMCAIKAPFAGRINRIQYKKGSLIEERALLTTLSDNLEIFAYFKISEKEALNFSQQEPLHQAHQVELIMANQKKYPVAGKIETVIADIDKKSGTVSYRARFNNAGEILKNGSAGKIRISHRLKKACLIPQKSTFEIQDKTYVYLLDSSNRVIRKSFIPRLRLAQYYVVESGISEQDRIIFEGIQSIREGEEIKPQLISLQQ
ncbi:MAG: efflux RND transporter periplasmic adaptor subunit [Cytophagaceae bacterium]|nr:efflux RND transporter periplasmic adaptor subunit [Cytophagaceae bacterium]